MDMIFRRRDVFDPDYVPEEIPFRDRQISQLVSCMQSMLQGSSPLNALCLGPPSTGKTSTIKFVMKHAAETDSSHMSYIRCPSAAEPYRIFSKIFHDVFSHQPPPRGISRATGNGDLKLQTYI
jgi:cell division control protein 6